jgi:hypothetical protein
MCRYGLLKMLSRNQDSSGQDFVAQEATRHAPLDQLPLWRGSHVPQLVRMTVNPGGTAKM